jgi:Uma2 family endonuclease
MGGGTLEHNAIIFNLVSDLKPALRGGPCKLYGQDLRLWVEPYQLFTYPDLLLICGLPKLFPGRKDTVTDASLIVEVLSPSTRDYDAGDKFKFYRSLPSFQEYLLISQDEFRVEHHVRQASNRWLMTEFTLPGATLPLATLTGVHLAMNSIYDGVIVAGGSA